VNNVLFHPEEDVILTCSQDKTARIWVGADSGYQTAHVVKTHTDEVVGISLHATNDYFATASLDRSWAFHDIRTGACLVRIADAGVKAGFSSVQFHPDGLILGTGTVDSLVRIWDIKSQSNVATFEGHQGKVVDIAFSENGFYLATAGDDGVKLWDLRKLKNFHTIADTHPVHSVAFDYSGSYLAVTSADVRVYAVGKGNFQHIKTFSDHSGLVTDVAWGKDAHWLASTSMDRSLKFYGK